MERRYFVILGMFVWMLATQACAPSPVTPIDGGGNDADRVDHSSACSPRCREGYGCIDGECITCCNPPCNSSSRCVCPSGEFCHWGEICDGYWQCEELDGGIDADQEADVETDADADSAADDDADTDEDQPSSCPAGSECEPEDIDTRACGCGALLESRECRADCNWGDWSGCPDPECSPDATRACPGDCGEGIQTCTDTCEWGPCDGPSTGDCVPGASRPCSGACGAGFERCSDSCEWGDCDAPATGECVPSASRPCSGACGAGFERCSDSCEWGDCDGPSTGDCVPSASRPCSGACGAGFERCSDTCEWGDCDAPATGECVPRASTSCTASCGTTGRSSCTDSCEWGDCEPPSEICNGLDDDCDGIIDNDLADCWRTLYRFATTHGWTPEARCLGTSRSVPATCPDYGYEREAFIVHAIRVPGTFEARQCSRGTDHILVDDRTGDRAALEAAGYNCSLVLGFLYIRGSGPAAHRTPFAHTCPLYRFRFDTPDGGAHLFSRGPELMGDLICEPPARADVQSTVDCFVGTPPGC